MTMPERTRKTSTGALPPAQVRAKVWLERAGTPALTEAAADLLEQIQGCGSLSEAARRLRFSYRRAWLLLDGLNRHWPQQVVKTATGGKHGGGATVTAYGAMLLGEYRHLQLQVEAMIDREGGAMLTRLEKAGKIKSE
jgi:molybdate transport system regulatory protein